MGGTCFPIRIPKKKNFMEERRALWKKLSRSTTGWGEQSGKKESGSEAFNNGNTQKEMDHKKVISRGGNGSASCLK